MPSGKNDIMAQAVYLAQLEAAKGNCKCATCQILRKATRAMTEQFLGGTGEANPGSTANTDSAVDEASNVFNLGEEED